MCANKNTIAIEDSMCCKDVISQVNVNVFENLNRMRYRRRHLGYKG